MDSIETVVIGAGVIGLATGRALAAAGQEVMVLEAEAAIGTGTSSRNSEVIHAGIYYPTGSLKARLCVQGRQLLYGYCKAQGVAHRQVGKLIIAVNDPEMEQLSRHAAQAQANGVDDLQWLTAAQVRALEPEVSSVGGLFSPSTGILDTHEYMLSLQGDIESSGGTVVLNTAVSGVHVCEQGFELSTHNNDSVLACRRLVNAAGLHAQDISRRIDGLPDQSIPPRYLAKGHYYSLTGRAPFSHLVYPMASAAGLGVHVTLDMSGAARFGPDVSWIDELDYSFDDSRRRSFSEAIRRYYAGLDVSRLQPAYTGIRPKVVGPGEAAADFIIQGAAEHGIQGLVSLYGMESPGLTASLAIGSLVSDMILA